MIRPTKTPQEVSPGEKLPALERTFTLVDLVLYGAATWDWNRMHYDVEQTHRLKLPAPMIDGQEFGAFFARAALEWAGPRAFLSRLALRMKAMAFAGETLRAQGEVKEMRDGAVVLTQRLTCGERLIAEATTELRLPLAVAVVLSAVLAWRAAPMPDASLPVEALKVASSGSVFHSSLPSGTLRAGYDVEQALQSAFVDRARGGDGFPLSRRGRISPHDRRADPRAQRRTTGRKASCAPPVIRTKIAAPRRAPSHDTAPPR